MRLCSGDEDAASLAGHEFGAMAGRSGREECSLKPHRVNLRFPRPKMRNLEHPSSIAGLQNQDRPGDCGASLRRFCGAVFFQATFIASGSQWTIAPRSMLRLLSSAAPAAR